MTFQMGNSEQSEKLILLDCDVISHFIANNALADLSDILAPHPCYVLDLVYSEVAVWPMRMAFLDAVIKSGQIQRMSFPDDLETKKEFARIKSCYPLIGDGERACMAAARFNENIVASSNFRDVAPYCRQYGVLFLGTLDILTVAFNKGIYDEQKCDRFIQNALTYNKACFPKGFTAIRFYKPSDLSFI